MQFLHHTRLFLAVYFSERLFFKYNMNKSINKFSACHIQFENVSHSYKNSKQVVLDNIEFEIKPGTSTSIVGRSGCGKTTLLQIACGMALPTNGFVFIDGTKVSKPSPRWNMMFQEALLYPWMTVFENASLGLRFSGKMNKAKEIVSPLLEMVGLENFRNVNVQDLSGGQQQRVALARSLATRPSGLFLDEPFSALDAITRRNLQRDVIKITKDIGITLLTVTHDLDEAILLGDKVIAMTPDPGRIKAIFDTPDTAKSENAMHIKKSLMNILGNENLKDNNFSQVNSKFIDADNGIKINHNKKLGQIHA